MRYFPKCHPIFSFEPTAENTHVLNLSVHNEDPALKKVQDCESLAHYIERQCQKAGKKYAYGGYGENRVIYQRFEQYRHQERCWHLGIDFWAPAGTKVRAPYTAQVHSFAYHQTEGDYGGTIILEHDIGMRNFYTLHGHLSLSSIEDLSEGLRLEAGQTFARLGSEAENGGWPPHLHFQVIWDLQGQRGDYPGVASAQNREVQLRNCPNPEQLLQWHLE